MTTSGDSSIIEFVMAQPTIYLSLVISLAILMIALGLWIIFYIRNRIKAPKNGEVVQSNQLENFDQSGTQEIYGSPSQVSKPEEVSSQSQGQSEPAAQLNGSQQSKEEQAAPVNESSEDKDAPVSVKLEEEKADGEESSNSHLASIFEETIMVDPQLQAMIDELPEIPISNLVEKIHDISTEMKKRNAIRYPE